MLTLLISYMKKINPNINGIAGILNIPCPTLLGIPLSNTNVSPLKLIAEKTAIYVNTAIELYFVI